MSATQVTRRATERGSAVAAARRRIGLSQPDLAERVGVGRASIARIEAGAQTPSVTLALAIAELLGESVETLFGGER